MALVRTEALKVGLTLARDVKNSQCQMLLRAGMVIQERHLMLLSSWGVSEVEVQEPGGLSKGQGPTTAEAEQSRRIIEIKESLQEKFRHNNLQSPVMVELFELCALRKAKQTK